MIINVQHKENIHPDFIENEIKQKVLTQLIDCINVDIQINRKSKFYKGGFVNDTGLTGRKIMIDTYGVSGNLVGISINLCKSIQKELFINDTP